MQVGELIEVFANMPASFPVSPLYRHTIQCLLTLLLQNLTVKPSDPYTRSFLAWISFSCWEFPESWKCNWGVPKLIFMQQLMHVTQLRHVCYLGWTLWRQASFYVNEEFRVGHPKYTPLAYWLFWAEGSWETADARRYLWASLVYLKVGHKSSMRKAISLDWEKHSITWWELVLKRICM